MEAIYKRELAGYFKSLVAYVVIAIFAFFTGFLFWANHLYGGSIDFSYTLSYLIIGLIVIIPIITMKLFADDKKNGTEILLRTAPVKTWEVVLGKYFAAVTVFLVMVAETMICPIIMSFLVNEDGVFPLVKTIGSYVAFIILGLVYTAIGTLASSLTDSQPVAAMLGIVILAINFFLETIGANIGGTIGAIVKWFSIQSRYNNFASGLFDIPSAFFMIGLTAVLLYVTTSLIDRKRWN